MTEPVLTPHDRQSAVWQKLKAHLDARLATLRVQNDTMPMDRTEKHRGRIVEVKALLALGEDKPVLEDENAIFKD